MLETGFSVNTLEPVFKKKFENKQPPTLITAIQMYVDCEIPKPYFLLFFFV